MQILAFDPGYGRLGWGAVSFPNSLQSVVLLGCGTVETHSKQDMSLRMQTLYGELCSLIEKYQPDCIAMERLYFSRNQKTAVGVYQAQGLILAAAGKAKHCVKELAPKVIKKAITGSGASTKEQLMQITCRILQQDEVIYPDDAADAVACAIASYFYFYSANKICEETKK